MSSLTEVTAPNDSLGKVFSGSSRWLYHDTRQLHANASEDILGGGVVGQDIKVEERTSEKEEVRGRTCKQESRENFRPKI